MPNCSESLQSGRAARCAACDGRFGLVRHYSWRTALCSRKCVARFKARQASDRDWLPWLQIALDQARETREDSLTFQISQRGEEYLKTAQTLLRAAQAMADRAIAGQLKALAEDYQRRADKASYVDSPMAFARSMSDMPR